MEAAVLPLAVLPEVDCNSNSLRAELEVKKLQELVWKLERQNEQLRTRTRTQTRTSAPSPACSQLSFCPPEEPLDYFQAHEWLEGGSEPSVLDELELLDLDSVSGSDASDETWLYVVATARDTPSGAPHPLQWCRQVLDEPKTEVDAARRLLSLQMEQVSRWRSSLCSPSSYSSSSSSSSSSAPPLNRVTPIPAPPSTKPCSTPQSSERHAPPLSNTLHSALHRTLSPVGKELPPVAERTPTFLPHPPARSRSLRPSVDGDPVVPEDHSISLGYKLQDLTDVQVMARLQEESLRQDLAGSWSVLAGRRSQSFSFQLSAAVGMEEEDEEEDDEDYGLLPPPQPRLTRLPHSHTFSSIRDWRRSTSSLCTPPSTPCTPPCPTAGFSCQLEGAAPPGSPAPGSPCTAELPLGFRPASAEYDSKLRRSMPNLLRAPNMPCVPAASNPCASPSLLRNSQSFDSPGGLARLHSSSQLHTRVQSVASFPSLSRTPLKATAYISPTVKGSASVSLQALSGIPLPSKSAGAAATPATTTASPRSGLPRPTSFVGTTGSAPRGKVVQSARSLLTSPKSLSTFSALRDAAWRDGCY